MKSFGVFAIAFCVLLAHAPASVKGRFVRLELSQNYLNVAEVEVMSGGKNVALHKAATQSSTLYNRGAELAVDGNTDGNADNGSVIHTGNGDEWWEVDLGGTFPIDSIVIYNRTDHAEISSPRIIGCLVRILNAERGTVWNHRITEAWDKYDLSVKEGAEKIEAPLTRNAPVSAPRPILIYADGDSVTAYPNNYTGSYASVIAAKLPKAGPVTVVNVAVSGQPQSSMLKNVEVNVLSKNPDIVTLCTSLNDILLYTGGVSGQATGKAALAHNLTSYIDQVLAKKNDTGLPPQLILMSDGFAGQALDKQWARPQRDQYDTAHFVLQTFRRYDKNPNVHVVDNFTSFYSLGIDTPQLFAHLISDHVHPNVAGYALIQHNVEGALIEAVQRVVKARAHTKAQASASS